ncbi:hypothetical protein SAMN05421780_12414 [Flexibacter flexilis DSM 6793]|uniref:Uncharacterized protein n=1 Tax=Flexibacter flexilis DSM 6793 TaxID=927664 RepID=A0A1I1P9P5_9BACT|nr:hypothetical protein [Flexibacter flexilis]SFD02710.1 hypothetical protein SAMN05421780_12414 [Flexibacter flexilis DSM 6793]
MFETTIGASQDKTPVEAGAGRTRQAALDRLGELPESIQEAIKQGAMIFIDRTVFGTREAGSDSVKIFKTDDDIKAGVCSLAKAMLEKDQHFICTAIMIEQGDSLEGFVPAPFTDAMHSAEIDLNTAGADRVKGLHMNQFYTANPDAAVGDSTKPYGFYKLKSPLYIPPQKEIKVTINGEAEIDGVIRVTLIGLQVAAKPNLA